MNKKEIVNNHSPIIFILKNTTLDQKTAVVLNYCKNFLSPNFGSEVGVNVLLEDNDKFHYGDVMELIDRKSFLITLESENPKQIRLPFLYSIVQQKQVLDIPIIPDQYIPTINSSRYDPNKIEIPIELELRQESGLEFTLLPMSNLTISIQ